MSAPNVTGHQSSSSSQQVDPAIEKLVRETKSLKAKIDLLEAENRALKKSLYDLSYIYSSQIEARHNGDLAGQRDEPSGSNGSAAQEDEGSNGAVRSNHSQQNSQARSNSNDMVSAMGQLLSNLSMAQQNQSTDTAAASPGQGLESISRTADTKKNVDLIKAEEEGVRRINMGNIGKKDSHLKNRIRRRKNMEHVAGECVLIHTSYFIFQSQDRIQDQRRMEDCST